LKKKLRDSPFSLNRSQKKSKSNHGHKSQCVRNFAYGKVVQKYRFSLSYVTLNFLYVDTAAMQIILNPTIYAILTENLFGDIFLSDEVESAITSYYR
jgi:isocitrate/isopropylmalate dehydrogenase